MYGVDSRCVTLQVVLFVDIASFLFLVLLLGH